MVTLLFIGSIAFSIYLLVTTGTPSEPLLSPLVYFYQVLGMVKSTPFNTAIVILESVANISPAASGSKGVCLVQSLNELQRQWMALIFHAFVTVSFGALYILHNLIVFKFRGNQRIPVPDK